MRYLKGWLLVALICLPALPSLPAAAGRAKVQRSAQEEVPKAEDPERAISGMVREMQMDLEASSGRGLLGKIDSAKFEDYPRFEDMIERLTREDTLRVFFRQASSMVKEDKAQTILDAEMELSRKDAAGQVEQRRQQLVIEFERTSRGWKIVNITPRDFFRPL